MGLRKLPLRSLVVLLEFLKITHFLEKMSSDQHKLILLDNGCSDALFCHLLHSVHPVSVTFLRATMVVPEMLSSVSHWGARAVTDNLVVGTEHFNSWYSKV